MHAPDAFPEHVLADLIDEGVITPEMSVLIVCGGVRDRDLVASAGFVDVTITNVDAEPTAGIEPYAWAHQDAENLDYADDSFDVGIVVAGLHHCRSPHRALLELLRVTRHAVVAFEARDSLTMRLMCRLGLAEHYEISAVADQGLRSGGVSNSAVPNYVYRWTERDFDKAVACYDAEHQPTTRFYGHLELPSGVRTDRHGRGLKGWLLRAVAALAPLLVRLAPSQRNHLAMVAHHGAAPLHPWLRLDDQGRAVPDEGFVGQRYPVRVDG